MSVTSVTHQPRPLHRAPWYSSTNIIMYMSTVHVDMGSLSMFYVRRGYTFFRFRVNRHHWVGVLPLAVSKKPRRPLRRALHLPQKHLRRHLAHHIAQAERADDGDEIVPITQLVYLGRIRVYMGCLEVCYM